MMPRSYAVSNDPQPSDQMAQNQMAQQAGQMANPLNQLNQPTSQATAQAAPVVPPVAHPMDSPTRIDHTNKSYQFAGGGFLPSFLGSAASTFNSTSKNRPKSKPAATDDDTSSGDWSWAKNDYDTTGG